MSYPSSLAVKGGAALLFVFFALVIMAWPLAGEADAAPVNEESQTSFAIFLTSGGLAGFLILLLGLGVVLCAIVGAVAGARGAPWPHWRPLVRGMGEGAFLLGILGAFGGMHQAMITVANMGAAVTPADLAGGIATSVVTIILGTLAALAALLGSGLIGLSTRRAAA
ncbi:MAG: hypothetical protein ACYTEZ_06690 [Planctomycetota bacterium]|jgi:hypothetical protein